MNSNSTTTYVHYDIINNILRCNITADTCLDKIKAYEAALSSSANNTELIRFSRHISLEAYFENIQNINNEIANNNTDHNNNNNNNNNSTDNVSAILSELSTITNSNTESDDTVLILQLSSTMDNLLKGLSASDRKIYLYRYFFAYSIENIANITGAQVHSIERALTSCNNKLKALIKESNLICDNKSLLLSLTDIDDSYLLPLINVGSKNENSKNTSDDENSISLKETRKPSLPKCLNFIFAATIIILAILNIAQYTDNKASNNSEKTDSSDEATNPNSFDMNSVYTNIDGEKVINFQKLMEYATYSDGYEQSFTYNSAYFTGEYIPLSLPDEFPLKDHIGTEIYELADEFKSYYRFVGSDNMQYIIRKFDDEYTLYQLSNVSISNEDLLTDPGFTTTYGEVLSTFYGATKSDDIKEISVWHANIDTDYADGLTKKVIFYEQDVYCVFNYIQTNSYNGMLLSDYCALNGLSKQFINDHSVQLVLHLKDGSANDRLVYYPDENWFYDTITEMIFVPDAALKDIPFLKEMLRFNEQKEEPSDPESWKLSLTCMDVDPEFLTVLIQDESTHSGSGLYISSEYTVQKLENDIWVNAPSGDVTVTHPIITYEHKIDSGVMISFPIREKYAPLEPGTYQLTLTVSDSHSEDFYHPNYKMFHVQFTIE